jgi:putative peptide-modifying radical SAM enzyme
MDSDFHNFQIEYALPRKINYDISQLEKFFRRDPDCCLTFYGGEPLLCINSIKEIMDNVKARHFSIQTNGLLLDHLDPEYLNRLYSILVSIDGNEVVTDSNRGKGTFRKIIDNLRIIKENDFQGELIVRMTVTEETDINRQVKWLLKNEEFPFSSVHWQLNAGFWNDFSHREFAKWIKENYNPGLNKLVKFWVDRMEDEEKVARLYPFLGLTQSLLSDEKPCLLRCGAGWINYGIQTDGHIIPCPSMGGMKDYYLGHINHTNPLKLRRISLNEPCKECDIFAICGGRCLYANTTKRWKNEEYNLVCETIRNLLNEIKGEIPRIRRLIKKGKINRGDFRFIKYFGCEIIP